LGWWGVVGMRNGGGECSVGGEGEGGGGQVAGDLDGCRRGHEAGLAAVREGGRRGGRGRRGPRWGVGVGEGGGGW